MAYGIFFFKAPSFSLMCSQYLLSNATVTQLSLWIIQRISLLRILSQQALQKGDLLETEVSESPSVPPPTTVTCPVYKWPKPQQWSSFFAWMPSLKGNILLKKRKYFWDCLICHLHPGVRRFIRSSEKLVIGRLMVARNTELSGDGCPN